MGIIQSIKSVIFQEGLLNFYKRKTNKTFLDNRTLFTINYNGRKTKIYLNKKFGYVDQYIFEHGIYEKDIIDKIRKNLSPEKVMLDIGSNIGQHSLLMAPYCKKIFAFEPIPAIYEEFQNSIKANKYDNIVLQNTAIGGKKEVKAIYVSNRNAGSSTFVENIHTESVNVQIDVLKNVLPSDLKFDVVKVDVEGFEAVVILENKDIFLENRPVFFLEFSPSSITAQGSHRPDDLINFFVQNNYVIYSDTTGKSYLEFSDELLQTSNWVITPNQQ